MSQTWADLHLLAGCEDGSGLGDGSLSGAVDVVLPASNMFQIMPYELRLPRDAKSRSTERFQLEIARPGRLSRPASAIPLPQPMTEKSGLGARRVTRALSLSLSLSLLMTFVPGLPSF